MIPLNVERSGVKPQVRGLYFILRDAPQWPAKPAN